MSDMKTHHKNSPIAYSEIRQIRHERGTFPERLEVLYMKGGTVRWEKVDD